MEHLKLLNWKTPGLDDIRGFCFNNFSYIHDGFATEMNKCIQKTGWLQERPISSKKTDSKEPPQTIVDP